MVFERILSSYLNNRLDAYIEKLDGKQLSIELWQGNVEFRNLVIKPSALDELDIPIQAMNGTIGKLTLKIPWGRNSYASPYELQILDISIVAVPNRLYKYGPVKKKDKPEADRSFLKKLLNDIIKNFKLRIFNINIRYVDKGGNPDTRFSCRISLPTLIIESN